MSIEEQGPHGGSSPAGQVPPIRSWVATFVKVVTLGLFIPWWRAGWFVVTDRRLIVRYGIFNKSEIALPLHFVQDASVHRSWLGSDAS